MSENIVSVMKRLYQTVLNRIEDDNKKHADPNWQLVNVHVTSPEVAELMVSPNTPLDTKCLLFLSTFIGQQWVYNEGEKAGEALIVRDIPILDWNIDDR